MTDQVWKTWAEQVKAFGVQLTAKQLEQFKQYETILLAWNQHTNLTAIREPAEIRQRHFLDAFSCVDPFLQLTPDLEKRRLIDIGTGAGFPGLPLKIAYPELHLTLVDSVRKKTDFLNVVVRELALPKIEIHHARAEDLGRTPEFREQFDWAIARSVAPLTILVELLLPLVRLGGYVLAQKGSGAEDELTEAAQAIKLLGGEPHQVFDYHLPHRPYRHTNVIIAKKQPTPGKYPRRPGIPAKRPLVE